MTLRRGFKTESERISEEVRRELKLGLLDRLDPMRLAGHLEIPVMGLTEYAKITGTTSAAAYFLGTDQECFSALTLFFDSKRVILHNESHAPTRRASNLAHELAHCILEHPPTPGLSAEGCRIVDKSIEEEADCLAGALLLPREALVAFLRKRSPETAIASHFGVSPDYCRWRVNITGAKQQINRAKAMYFRR